MLLLLFRLGHDSYAIDAGQVSTLLVLGGLVLVQGAKAWFIDRMVLLFEDMKARRPSSSL